MSAVRQGAQHGAVGHDTTTSGTTNNGDAMHYNQSDYHFYVVNVDTRTIDSGWESRLDAMTRAVALKEEGASNVKVMTRPRVWDRDLDPNDDANWTPCRSNPGRASTPRWGPLKGGYTRWCPRCAAAEHPMKTQEQREKCARLEAALKKYGSPKRKNPGKKYSGSTQPRQGSGYTDCACPDCFDIAISDDMRAPEFCWDCREAGCTGEGECQRLDAYGVDEGAGDGGVVENPPSVVKTKRDERLWKMAKKSAAEQGRAEDWQYIMGIFQRMKHRVGGGKWVDWTGMVRENPRYTGSFYVTTFCNRAHRLLDGKPIGHNCYVLDLAKLRLEAEGRMDEIEGSIVKEPRREMRRGTRENPGELLVVNPATTDATATDAAPRAERVYKMWHQKDPHNVGVFKTSCRDDDAMICVGRAHNIVYRSGKWEKGRKTNDYIHHFDSKPKVWMVAHLVEAGLGSGGAGIEGGGGGFGTEKSVGDLMCALQNGDGRFEVAELAVPLSLGLDDGTTEGTDIKIHAGSKVYGGVDKKTVVICDPHWKLIVIKGGKMHFDERGIVK